VLLGPTDAAVDLLKSHFCCFLTTNQQSFYQGKSGYYLLACAECMESYRESFLLVAAASAPKDLPAQYVELRSLQDANAFIALRYLIVSLFHRCCYIFVCVYFSDIVLLLKCFGVVRYDPVARLQVSSKISGLGEVPKRHPGFSEHVQ
jgi:hypothetical protein